jgi:hypothetical protein
VVVSHGVWLETLLRLYAPEYWNASNVLAATNGYPKRVYNTDAYQCEVVSRVNSSSRNDGAGGTFVRIQNVRQICEQHQVANACRMTALGQT